MVPSKPGSINQAVECIIIPNLQILDLHSHLQTKSYGIFIFSKVTPRTKSPG